MQRSTRVLGTLLGAAFIVTACDDAGTGPNGATLSAAEAAALAAQIDLLGSGAASSSTGSQLGAYMSGSADVASQTAGNGTIQVSIDVTAPCPHGGTLRLAGTHNAVIDVDARRIEAATSAAATPADCGVTVEGSPLFLNGSLDYGEEHTLLWDPVQYDGTVQHSGTIDWRRGSGAAGSCVIDVTTTAQFSRNGSQSTGSRLIQGTVCGHAVNHSLNWTWTGS